MPPRKRWKKGEVPEGQEPLPGLEPKPQRNAVFSVITPTPKMEKVKEGCYCTCTGCREDTWHCNGELCNL